MYFLKWVFKHTGPSWNQVPAPLITKQWPKLPIYQHLWIECLHLIFHRKLQKSHPEAIQIKQYIRSGLENFSYHDQGECKDADIDTKLASRFLFCLLLVRPNLHPPAHQFSMRCFCARGICGSRWIMKAARGASIMQGTNYLCTHLWMGSDAFSRRTVKRVVFAGTCV